MSREEETLSSVAVEVPSVFAKIRGVGDGEARRVRGARPLTQLSPAPTAHLHLALVTEPTAAHYAQIPRL